MRSRSRLRNSKVKKQARALIVRIRLSFEIPAHLRKK